MPRYLSSESAETIRSTLADALDLVDFGIVLLDRDLRIRFVNSQFGDMWRTGLGFLDAEPTFRSLLNNAASRDRYPVPTVELPGYLDRREAEVRAGSAPPVLLELADGRRFLFRCIACPDGGRILTYVDISRELRREVLEAVEQASAELRFNAETMEDQASHLAALAEAAEQNAQRAEAACLLLEREVAERRQLEIQLRRLATTDGLTGAFNRAELLAAAQRQMELGQVDGQTLVVLMLDVDHFKAINDRFGHAGGDRALQHLVATLHAGIRQVDLLGRLGGEEFAVVLIDTPPSSAAAVAERLRALVADAPVVFGRRLIPMTISVGLAIRRGTDRSIEQVLARADAALYRAKSTGRNRVVRDLRQKAA